mmetsp:Transcript_9585/g.30692  ORF Transcript_9585/g.30692 Transcript_9585/m.30692 type:complete len:408 (+) Transcript_9585:371-1594(+)
MLRGGAGDASAAGRGARPVDAQAPARGRDARGLGDADRAVHRDGARAGGRAVRQDSGSGKLHRGRGEDGHAAAPLGAERHAPSRGHPQGRQAREPPADDAGRLGHKAVGLWIGQDAGGRGGHGRGGSRSVVVARRGRLAAPAEATAELGRGPRARRRDGAAAVRAHTRAQRGRRAGGVDVARLGSTAGRRRLLLRDDPGRRRAAERAVRGGVARRLIDVPERGGGLRAAERRAGSDGARRRGALPERRDAHALWKPILHGARGLFARAVRARRRRLVRRSGHVHTAHRVAALGPAAAIRRAASARRRRRALGRLPPRRRPAPEDAQTPPRGAMHRRRGPRPSLARAHRAAAARQGLVSAVRRRHSHVLRETKARLLPRQPRHDPRRQTGRRSQETPALPRRLRHPLL